MARRVEMSNGELHTTAFYGFSWTSLIFGCFPAAFRGDWGFFAVMLFITVVLNVATGGIAGVILNIILGFVYNKYHGRGLVERGYKPVGYNAEDALKAWNK